MTVYFARSLDTGLIKIGMVYDGDRQTLSRVYQRLAQVSTVVGATIELLAHTAGRRRVELWFHKRHAAAAISGEWFSPTEDLLADIAMLKDRGIVDGQPAEPMAAKQLPSAPPLKPTSAPEAPFKEPDPAVIAAMRPLLMWWCDREKALELGRASLDAPYAGLREWLDEREGLATHHARYRCHVVREVSRP